MHSQNVLLFSKRNKTAPAVFFHKFNRSSNVLDANKVLSSVAYFLIKSFGGSGIIIGLYNFKHASNFFKMTRRHNCNGFSVFARFIRNAKRVFCLDIHGFITHTSVIKIRTRIYDIRRIAHTKLSRIIFNVRGTVAEQSGHIT
jgi:hypothetical protein